MGAYRRKEKTFWTVLAASGIRLQAQVAWDEGDRMRCLGTLILLALAALPLGANAAGLPVAKSTYAEKSKTFDISVEYPKTGNAAIDQVLATYAKASAQRFKADSADARQPGDPAYTLETTFHVDRNDGKIFAVVFEEYMDTSGAHPNGNYATFNFSLPDGAQIFLPEMLDGARGIKRLSDLVQADLLKRIGTGSDAASDPDTIKMGSGPYADNFKDFVLLPDKIHILFPAYQVASYAAGPQEAFVSLAGLKDVIRKDWRAPAASFDCALAKSATEKAICSDASLARLDRQVAEEYARQMRDAYEEGAKTKLKQAQRDFVAARDKACTTTAPSVACLKGAYAARLTVLQKT
jgi:uncharacterized protein YecT (DUF1311 family)